MISTKGRYALRLMIDIANQQSGKAVPLKDVAERQGISKKYLEVIAKTLVEAGLLKGTSGKGGGYMLVKNASDYNVCEIIVALEGSLSPVSCLADGHCNNTCPRKDSCKTLPMWTKLDTMLYDFFYGIKLTEFTD